MSRGLIALVLATSSLAHAQDATAPAEPTTPPAPVVPPAPTVPDAPAEQATPTPPSEPAAPADSATTPPTTDPSAAGADSGTTAAGADSATTAAAADSATTPAPADMSDQAIGASIGAAIGGRTTVGGLRVAGHFLYQLSTQDWFDGTAAFTFGSGAADCFRDRDDNVLCDHGLADGYAVELGANVRRFLGGNDKFWPFARAGVGVALVRFSDDDVTGLAIPLHAGAGLRISVADGIALTGQAELELGFALFGSGVGVEPQLGVNVSAGVEFRL